MHGENISCNAMEIFLQWCAETINGAAKYGGYFGSGQVGDGVGSDVSGMGRLGSGARSWDLHAFNLFLLS